MATSHERAAGLFRACVEHIAAVSPQGEMIRVGAHQAWHDRNDPLQRAGVASLRTLLVEPQPSLYALLSAAAAQEYPNRVKVLNAAVCQADGNVTFFMSTPHLPKEVTLARRGVPSVTTRGVALTQAASLSREHVVKHMEAIRSRAWEISQPGSALRSWCERPMRV